MATRQLAFLACLCLFVAAAAAAEKDVTSLQIGVKVALVANAVGEQLPTY
jgi:hypothetical protein